MRRAQTEHTPLTCNPCPRWLRACCRCWPACFARYLSVDPRTLGLARIYLGALLLIDLLRRIPHLRTWYTNAGPLPNHVLLWRPVAKYQFSLFFLASRPGEAVFLFVLCGLVFALLLVGYRTRLMQCLSLVAICSLHNRLALMEDGSEVTTRLLAFWTSFLPLGARFSVDAVARAQAQGVREPETRPALSLAVPAILLQIALLYLFNVLHKTGETWREGSAVHYVLHQDRIVTWLGWQVRPYVGAGWSRVLTYSTIVVEATLPLLVLSPIATKLTRRIAILLAIGLHLGFAALLNLGMFSFNMIGFYLLLLSDRDWARLERLPLGGLPARCEAWTRAAFAALGPTPSAACTPVRQRLSLWASQAREAVILLFALALGSQMAVENRALPDALRVWQQPLLFQLLVEYPRFYEGWSMFAPEAPKRDFYFYVDALTVDGRHVDPINQLASRVAELPVHAVPEFLDQDDSWCDYTYNVVGREEYYRPLSEFIRSYSRRTRRPRDRITSFQVWLLEDDSPEPGQTTPRNVTQKLLLEE